MRLLSRDNATDKWVLKGVNPVSAAELDAISKVASAADEPLTFVDIGANTGLYTLQVAA